MSGEPVRRRVVVTEAEGPGRTLAARLAESGIDVRLMPVVSHTPATDAGPLDDALARLDTFDWVVFTSARTVDVVCAHAAWRRIGWAEAGRPRVAAVGPITRAALTARDVPVDLCPDEPGARALAEAMVRAGGGTLTGRTILWPCSSLARPELADILQGAGARIVAPVAYCTVSVRPPDIAEVLAQIEAGEIDGVAFLSPSGAAALAAALPGGCLAAIAARTVVASVGPTTSAALRELGAPPAVEAASRTAGGLAAALLSYFGPGGRNSV